MTDKRLAASEEYLEPELLSPGGGPYKPRGEGSGPRRPPEKPGLLTRLKMLLAGGLAILGAGLFTLGAVLTSTVIGAIIGIPLMLLGAAVFVLLFKLLSTGPRPPIIFRRF
ncbi:MAG: hypothetical protein HY550_01045 [Elusimicrobia bacterium]|nr:hypothetical protein [Elusimicrobiota bacterium]